MSLNLNHIRRDIASVAEAVRRLRGSVVHVARHPLDAFAWVGVGHAYVNAWVVSLRALAYTLGHVLAYLAPIAILWVLIFGHTPGPDISTYSDL